MLIHLIRLSLSLAGTRLLAMTMPVFDVVILMRQAPDAWAAYALAAQWAQIGVVACGSLATAVMVCVPRCVASRRAGWLPDALHASLVWGSLVAIALVTLTFPVLDPPVWQVAWILALGMPALAVYTMLSGYLQCMGRSSDILLLTGAAGLVNAGLDVALLHVLDPHIAVAVSTAACWFGLALMVCLHRSALRAMSAGRTRRTLLFLRASGVVRSRFASLSRCAALGARGRRLLAVALPDFLSRSGFVGAMALGAWWLNAAMTTDEFGRLAATLNYMNVISVIVLAISAAFGVVFLEQPYPRSAGVFSGYGCIAMWVVLGLHFLFAPVSARLYFGYDSAIVRLVLALGMTVVLIDGLALLSVTWLRMHRPVSPAPYLRLLMFPCAAAYLHQRHHLSAESILLAMAIGNSVVAGLTITWAARARPAAIPARR